jgi:hypothetical protein
VAPIILCAPLSEDKVRENKARVRSGLILSVVDILISLVASKQDPADSWDLLKKMYNVGDQQQILLLTNKLYNLSMKEGGDINAYLTEASELRDRLRTLGEQVPDKTLNNIILNGLPKTYKMVIQGISYMTNPSFEDVMGKIITETHRLAVREQKIGQEEALSLQAQRHHRPNFPCSFDVPQFCGNFNGPRGRGFFQTLVPSPNFMPIQPRTPFFGSSTQHGGLQSSTFTTPSNHVRLHRPSFLNPRFSDQNFHFRGPRPPITCYSCGGPGHLARNCWYNVANLNYVDSNDNYVGENYAGVVEYNAATAFTNYYNNNWYVDSGATSHVTGQRASLELLQDNSRNQTVTTAGGGSHQISGIGSTTVMADSGGINLNRVLYVPALKRNLMSVGSIADEGYALVFTKTHCLIMNNDVPNHPVVIGHRDTENGLYKFTHSPATTLTNDVSHTQTSKIDIQNNAHLWQWHYGHLHYEGLFHLLKANRVRGLTTFERTTHTCGVCLAGCQCRERFPKSSTT